MGILRTISISGDDRFIHHVLDCIMRDRDHLFCFVHMAKIEELAEELAEEFSGLLFMQELSDISGRGLRPQRILGIFYIMLKNIHFG